MANPTTNYGFVLPTSTDLVTDLPADFDVALQGVDTRLKALQPGTTLGDIAYSSATANTNTRLGIGTTGQILAVSAGVPAWTTPAAAGGQTLLNPGGTTLSGASVTISSIPATYKDLKIVMTNRTLNADGDYAFRFNGDSGSNRYQQPIGGAKTFNSNYMLIGEYGLSTDVGSYHLSYCFDYALTTTYKMLMVQVQVVTDQNNSSGFNWSRSAGIYSQLGAINSITVLPTTATSFTGGTIYVYGVS